MQALLNDVHDAKVSDITAIGAPKATGKLHHDLHKEIPAKSVQSC